MTQFGETGGHQGFCCQLISCSSLAKLHGSWAPQFRVVSLSLEGALTPLNQLCPWRDSPSLLAVSSRWLPTCYLWKPGWSGVGLPSHWGACPLPRDCCCLDVWDPRSGSGDAATWGEGLRSRWEGKAKIGSGRRGLTSEPDVLGETRCFQEQKGKGLGDWEVRYHSYWYQSG